ncbi:MAG: protease modulator HflK [Planctomycetota bacterium]
MERLQEHGGQPPDERAAGRGDAASEALNEALRVSFWLLKIAMVAVAIFFLFSGFYEVKEYERALVLRFGQLVYHRDPKTGERTPLVGPGLHLAWPFLIDEVVHFPVGRIIEEPIDAFWYREREDQPGRPVPAGIKPGTEGFNLTGDANILHSRWVVRYRVTEPERFLAGLADPDVIGEQAARGGLRSLVHTLLQNAVIRSVASFGVDEAYRKGKESLRLAVQRDLRRRLDAADVGVALAEEDPVLLTDIVPPRQAKEAFDDVIKAEQEYSRLVHNAEGEANKILSQARSRASRILAQAAAYEVQVKEQAEADADYIEDLLAKYPDNPEMIDIFLEQRLIEVVKEVLDGAEEVYVVQPGPGGEREIRILLQRDPELRRQRREGEEKPARTAPE